MMSRICMYMHVYVFDIILLESALVLILVLVLREIGWLIYRIINNSYSYALHPPLTASTDILIMWIKILSNVLNSN